MTTRGTIVSAEGRQTADVIQQLYHYTFGITIMDAITLQCNYRFGIAICQSSEQLIYY